MAAKERCVLSRKQTSREAHDVQQKKTGCRPTARQEREMADQFIFLQSINMPESQFWESDNRQPVGAAGCLDKNLDPPVEAAGH